MRYSIKDGVIVSSLSIDAPYDTMADAKESLREGMIFNDNTCIAFQGRKFGQVYVIYDLIGDRILNAQYGSIGALQDDVKELNNSLRY